MAKKEWQTDITVERVKEIAERELSGKKYEKYIPEYEKGIVIRGKTKTPKGDVILNSYENSFNFFVEEPKREQDKEFNLLSRLNNHDPDVQNETPITYMKEKNFKYTDFSYIDDKTGKKVTLELNENTADKLFPTDGTDWRGKKVQLTKVSALYKEPLIKYMTKFMTYDLTKVEKANGVETIVKDGIVGSVDDRLLYFHKTHSNILMDIINALSMPNPEKQVELKMRYIKDTIDGRKVPYLPHWIETIDVKMVLAMIVGLLEKYPITSWYLPAGILKLDIVREAINEGMKFRNETPIAWDKANDYDAYYDRDEGESYNIPLKEFFDKECEKGNAGKVAARIEDNLLLIGRDYENQPTLEDIKEELEIVRERIAKAMERKDIPEWTPNARQNNRRRPNYVKSNRYNGNGQQPIEKTNNENGEPKQDLPDLPDLDDDDFPF